VAWREAHEVAIADASTGVERARSAVSGRLLAVDTDGTTALELEGLLVSPGVMPPPERVAAAAFIDHRLVTVQDDGTLGAWSAEGCARCVLPTTQTDFGAIIGHPRLSLVCVERFTPQDTSSFDVVSLKEREPHVLHSIDVGDAAEIVGFTSDDRGLVLLVGGASLERHELFHRHAGPCAVWDAPRGTRLCAPTGIGSDRLALVLEDDEGARLVILSEDFTHGGEWRLPARPPVLGVVVLGAHRIGLFREASSEWLELCALPAPAGDEGLRFG
jgi:hypothetical protein